MAIGDTVVTCTSSDTRGNTATEKFTITVRSAAQQVKQIGAAITSMHLDTTVASQLQPKADAILAALASPTGTPCNSLKTFDNNVNAKAGKPKGLTTDQATQLYAATTNIRAVIGGCAR